MKDSKPEAPPNPPIARQDGHADRRNAGRTDGSVCADPSEERSKTPHTLAGGSPAQPPGISSQLPTALAVPPHVLLQEEGHGGRWYWYRRSCPSFRTSETVGYSKPNVSKIHNFSAIPPEKPC